MAHPRPWERLFDAGVAGWQGRRRREDVRRDAGVNPKRDLAERSKWCLPMSPVTRCIWHTLPCMNAIYSYRGIADTSPMPTSSTTSRKPTADSDTKRRNSSRRHHHDRSPSPGQRRRLGVVARHPAQGARTCDSYQTTELSGVFGPEGTREISRGSRELGDRTPPVGREYEIFSSGARTQGAFRFTGNQKCAGQAASAGGLWAARCWNLSRPAVSWICFPSSLDLTGGFARLGSLHAPANFWCPSGTESPNEIGLFAESNG